MKSLKVFARTTIYLLITATIIVACKLDVNLPTPLPKGNCPVQPETEFSDKDYKFLDDKSKFVIVLVDKSYQYTYTSEVLEYISERFLSKINPGDRIVIAWMGANPTTDSIFLDKRIETVDLPQFPFKPILPLLTPTIEINKNDPNTTQGNQAIENAEINKANDSIKMKYYCEVGKWNYVSGQIYDQWIDGQQSETDSFLQVSRNIIDTVASSDPEPGKLVYNFLSLVSQMIIRAKENQEFTDYVLIIFSDMYEDRPNIPESVEIDFSGVKIAVAIHTCDYAINCEPLISRWKGEFEGFGVVKPKIFTKDDNISKALDKFMLELP